MKYAVRLIAAVLSWILLLNLVACSDPAPAPEHPTAPTQPVLTAGEIYDAAKAKVLVAPNRITSYTITRQSTVAGQQTYHESTLGTASFSDVGTENMIAIVDEDLVYGTVKAEHLLSFCNGRTYSRISGCVFGADMTATEFMDQQLPAALLDATLYESIVLANNSDGAVITFSQPKDMENWVDTPSGATMVSAGGTATLDTDGVLVQTTYKAEYTCGDVQFSLTVSLRCTTPAQLELSSLHPEHPEDYATLSCLDAPKLLLRAAGNIFSSNTISATAEETIYSEMIPLTRQRSSQISASGQGQTLLATLSNTVSVKDYRDQPSITTQTYSFQNGVCSVIIDGGEPTVQPEISAQSMRASIEDTLLSALFATRYLAGATITEQEDVYRLEFTGNEAYCEDLTQALSGFLNLSMEGVTSHHSTLANGYLCIDKVTGLPVAMGMYFSRTHMFGDIPYRMSYQLDQVISFTPAA
ncbi:MAG: hypothetical protein E7448_04020 [Ruminococcaceae bacterium]|nr:hypothetical protein [Oscillospiraceae bacterium]